MADPSSNLDHAPPRLKRFAVSRQSPAMPAYDSTKEIFHPEPSVIASSEFGRPYGPVTSHSAFRPTQRATQSLGQVRESRLNTKTLPGDPEGKPENIEALDAVSENEDSSANGLATAAIRYSPSSTIRHESSLKHIGEAPVEETHDKISNKIPATPKKKAGMEDTGIELLSDRPMEFPDPPVPPVSRNPLSSPMFKEIHAFRVASATAATTQFVDSPLIPPRTQLRKLGPTKLESKGRTEKASHHPRIQRTTLLPNQRARSTSSATDQEREAVSCTRYRR